MLILLLILSIAIYSCTRKIYIPIEKKVVISEEIRDTVIQQKTDSATLQALLECDSLGNVRLKEIQGLKSGSSSWIDFWLKNNILNVRADFKPPDIKLQYKNTHTSTTETAPVYIERKAKWWEKLLMGAGVVSLLLVLPAITIALCKRIFSK